MRALEYSPYRILRPRGITNPISKPVSLLRLLGLAALVVLMQGRAVRAAAGPSQGDRLTIDYTVKIASIDNHLFHVTADVKNIDQPQTDLSLPTWTPGWYTVENYAKNILRFQITDVHGNALHHTMTRKQTWRVNTAGLHEIRAEFDYYANILALNQAKITRDYAFFTGTEIFLMADGHRNTPSTVTLQTPDGWKVETALRSTSDPMKFTAPDYDTLVDCPTEMGHFDVTEFEVEGKPHTLVVTPSGSLPKAESAQFTKMLAAIAITDSRMFGGLPYEKYTYFYFFAPAESNASGALEHLSSHVTFAPPGGFATPARLASTAAHEYFHLWNVKRIRPIQMWPYEYYREDETPLLWVSEGFTNYYGNISRYRAGLIEKAQFLETVSQAITGVEDNEARKFIPPAESSVSTWLGYDSPVEFSISYYTQGQNLGALLDLSILHDTGGKKSLDDVMRALYHEFYMKGKGFSTEDMIGVINSLTGHDYHDFFSRYVEWTDVPPYDTILGYAGYKPETTNRVQPSLGMRLMGSPDGIEVQQVEGGSPAAKAGIQRGDMLVSIDGLEATRRFMGVQERLVQKMGQNVPVVITRDGKPLTLQMKVEGESEGIYHVVEMPNPTPEQLKVREGWLRK